MVTRKEKDATPPKSNIVQFIDASRANDQDGAAAAVKNEIVDLIKASGLDGYKILFLHDEHDSITSYHANNIYSAAAELKSNPKDVLLIINSNGGEIEPSYLLSKTLKRLAKDKFVVAIPRKAKSAATLICLGANEIHMGMMSELGPIDPQINGLPALALGNALDVIADLACRFPESASLLGPYISDQVPIRVLGYYQRVSESAVQYAERLLGKRPLGEGQTAHLVAEKLVNHYKDHSFVIDYDESIELFGANIVKEESPEYDLADKIYKFLDIARIFARIDGKEFWLVGDESSFTWRDKAK
ncbi:ATP-dependent Clp protease proteolytic subunit [Neorhizobium sp. NCHU2750]|uniref:SDH family Clp fold serine proteinase n=1 Tax=Neorhizobium sp. NCHU2750 TaxID=1825976 RepID=UPI000E75E1BC|nr:hypothetical protein NCHU2750_14180 [Neorhizobium sp. NCHU2750]